MSQPVLQAPRMLLKPYSSSTSTSMSAIATAAASSLRMSSGGRTTSWSRPCLLCTHQPTRCRSARRQFSTTRRHGAVGDLKPTANLDSRLPATYSSKTQMNKHSTTKEKLLPTDLGLLPQTLILSSTTSDLPPWLSGDVFKRARIHFFQLRMALQNWSRYGRFN